MDFKETPDGKYLFFSRRERQYGSGILWVLDRLPMPTLEQVHGQKGLLNTPQIKYLGWKHHRRYQPYSSLRGKFFLSKKGTPCFAPDENGQHVLFQQDWIQRIHDYDLYKAREQCPEALFFYGSRSNAGRSGAIHLVLTVVDAQSLI